MHPYNFHLLQITNRSLLFLWKNFSESDSESPVGEVLILNSAGTVLITVSITFNSVNSKIFILPSPPVIGVVCRWGHA